MGKKLLIYTFGGFYITDGVSVFSNTPVRNNKMWGVLKYLIAYRGKPVLAEKLMDVFWPEEDCANPAKSLRDVIYRLRKTLLSYGGDQPYIIFAYDSYYWNPKVDCYIDVVEFEKLLQSAQDLTKDDAELEELYTQAIDLYRGTFLNDATPELWIANFENYYRRLYLQAVFDLAKLYEKRWAHDDIVLLYDKALEIEPHEETLYIQQIRALIDNGEYAHAKRQYKQIEKILLREFGAKPSNELAQLNIKIDKSTTKAANNLTLIKNQLEQEIVRKNAIFCGFETFRQIYSFDKRSEERIQFPVFLGLITVSFRPEYAGSEDDMKYMMKTLRTIILRTLRRGDIISQYSANQFIFMLTTTDDKGAQIALNRIQQLFENEFAADRFILETQISPIGKGDEEIFSAM